jgi:plastocyanin
MSCEKEEHMRSKNTRLPRRSTPAWLCLLVGGALVLLSACGSGSPSSTGSDSTPTPTPTTLVQTPTPTSAQPTPTPAPGNMQVVLITNTSNGSFDFTPARLTIRVGTTVIWKNRSSAPHTVTSDDGTTFDSGTVPAGGTFHFTFKTAGTFSYHCNIHPYMRSMIIVV